MSDSLIKFKDMVIESAGELAAGFGLNRVVGQLYALLYISPKPLSLSEMTDQLKMSKGNTSVNIRELGRWGAVRKVWIKGSRKDYYAANLDIPGVVLHRLKVGLTNRMDKVAILFREAELLLGINYREANKKNNEYLKIYQQRIAELKKMHKRVVFFLKMLSPNLIRKIIKIGG